MWSFGHKNPCSKFCYILPQICPERPCQCILTTQIKCINLICFLTSLALAGYYYSFVSYLNWYMKNSSISLLTSEVELFFSSFLAIGRLNFWFNLCPWEGITGTSGWKRPKLVILPPSGQLFSLRDKPWRLKLVSVPGRLGAQEQQ